MKFIKGVQYRVTKGNEVFTTGENFQINKNGLLFSDFRKPSDIVEYLDGCTIELDSEWCNQRKRVLLSELDAISIALSAI